MASFNLQSNKTKDDNNTALRMSNASVHLPLRTFSALVRDYQDEQNDKTADALLTHLNELSSRFVSFDSEDVNQRHFISSVFKMMSLVQGHSTLAWCSLTLIENICESNISSSSLDYLRKLVPVVSKLMPFALSEERKLRVLKVLQTLTYGIKLQGPESFVGPLMMSLINWFKIKSQDLILQLCLSILTNLLHQNNVTLNILMKIVNLKEFFNDILCVRFNILCKMEVCKLMFLLEDLIHERPDDAEITNFLKVSFCTILDSSNSGSKSSLHHCISFFNDMICKNKVKKDVLQNACFLESARKIINQLEVGLGSIDFECAMFLFKFLGTLVQIRAPIFFILYPDILRQGLAWVSRYTTKASETINTMHIILDSHDLSAKDVASALSVEDVEKVVIPLLNGIMTTNENTFFFQTCLLKFLKEVLSIDALKPAIKENLHQEMIESFLEAVPVMNNLCNYAEYEPVVTMHVYLLIFVNEVVSCCDGSWIKFYMSLTSMEKVISVLAVALLHGSSDLKAKVLSLICSVGFPGESLTILAKTMTKWGSGEMTLSEHMDNDVFEQILYPKASHGTTQAQVNKLISNLKHLLEQNKLHEISTVQLMQLCEYNEQVNFDYQQSLLASLTNATAEKTLLHDKIYASNKIISALRQELETLQPSLESVRQKYDSALKEIQDNQNKLKTLKTKYDEEILVRQATIRTLNQATEKREREVKENLEKIQNLKSELVQKTNQFASLEESKEKLKKERDDLLEEVKNNTEQIKDKEATIEELSKQNAHLLTEMKELESNLKTKSLVVSQLEEEKASKDREIQELQRIRATVFELTGGGKKMA